MCIERDRNMEWLFGKRAATVEREQQDQVNGAVTNTSNNVGAMEKKRALLLKRAERVKGEAVAASRAQQQSVAESKAAEYQDVMRQVETLDAILENQRATRSVMDQASVNVNAFETQRTAAQALETMTAQVREEDVDEIASKLELQMGRVDDMSRVMTTPLRRHPQQQAKRNNGGAQNLLSSWTMQDMPDGGDTVATTTSSVTNVSVDQSTQQKAGVPYK